jgi:uncharacterized protein involved in exopolysaccharide biosynthesis
MSAPQINSLRNDLANVSKLVEELNTEDSPAHDQLDEIKLKLAEADEAAAKALVAYNEAEK